jgi:hypothetical protein
MYCSYGTPTFATGPYPQANQSILPYPVQVHLDRIPLIASRLIYLYAVLIYHMRTLCPAHSSLKDLNNSSFGAQLCS